jgi:hypothetical protein
LEFPKRLGIGMWNIVQEEIDRLQLLAEQGQHILLVTEPEVPPFSEPERDRPPGRPARRESPGWVPTSQAIRSRSLRLWQIHRVESSSAHPVHRLQEIRRRYARGDAHLDYMVRAEEAGQRIEFDGRVNLHVRSPSPFAMHPVEVSKKRAFALSLLYGMTGPGERAVGERPDPGRVGVRLDLHGWGTCELAV